MFDGFKDDSKLTTIEKKEGSSMLKVMKRTGQFVEFDRSKIELAMLKCYMDPKVYGPEAKDSEAIREKITAMTSDIVVKLESLLRPSILIEDIQDMVENTFMVYGEQKAFREYVIFRERRSAQRPTDTSEAPKVIHITTKSGERKPLDERGLLRICHEAAEGLNEVNPVEVCASIIKNLYDGVKETEVAEAMMDAAKVKIEMEPEYNYMTARLLLSRLRREVFAKLGLKITNSQKALSKHYGELLNLSLQHGVKLGMISPKLTDGRFDIERLGKVLEENAHADFQFKYHGIKTLYDRYFLHERKIRYELPQTFLMRVAMGQSINEADPTFWAIEFYKQYSSFDTMSSTPTLFNSGTVRPQLSSCFLTTIPDDLHGIYMGIHDNALLSKYAGGIGNDWTPVRGIGSLIKGTNGNSSGVIPFMKVANDTAIAVNQGGKRKGAVCGYLETWHRDIEAFLELRKNTGDDRQRTHDMNIANWIPDLFMERVMEGGSWSLFSPNEVPELHDLVGDAFRAKYEEYEAKGQAGELDVYKKIEAIVLWRKMLSMIFETGHPWFTFKDPCNLRSPQQHVGVVHSSNLCTEITLNTSVNKETGEAEEIAVCNLASINAPAHVAADGTILFEKLKKTVTRAIRMLDNVIDVNYYTVPAARNSNMKHRPIGLGIMGFQDVLFKMRIPYSSDRAGLIADNLQEAISYYAIEASADLAQERGSYESFEGSLWSKGILPYDSQALVNSARKPGHYTVYTGNLGVFDWEALRAKVMKGMRNSNLMAQAPTATISNIIGVTQSIEPIYGNLYTQSNMSGDFVADSEYLIRELKALDLWDERMVQDLKYFDGSVQKIERIPQEIRDIFATAFEVPYQALINAGARRQKWMDQAQSLNLYMAQPSGKKLDEMYKHAWVAGLKTTYYLRTVAATGAEKTTITDSRLNKVTVTAEKTTIESPGPVAITGDLQLDGAKMCLLTDPNCEACQ